MNARVEPSVGSDAKPANLDTTAAETSAAAAATLSKRNGRRLALMISVPLILVALGAYFWLTGGRYQATDNAYVQQSVVSLSADVSGRIIDVQVSNNQPVKAGDILFHIDPEPYRIALAQAQAALATARVNVDQLRVSYRTAEAKLTAAEATLSIRQREQGRVTSLAGKGISTAAASDNALLSAQDAQTDVNLGRQAVAAAAAALGGDPAIDTENHPSVMSALAAVESAERNLNATTVRAPANGVISQVESLNAGQFIATGTTIASLVETSKSWVEANFKETQLGALAVGQSAEIGIDAYPGVALHGTIVSIGAATGSEFSLIPAQNATGNWVKVVQRIPVRIAIEDKETPTLRTGMSSEVSVDTGKSRLDEML